MEAGVEFRVVGPGDEKILAELFPEIDETFFRPHSFTPEEARAIAGSSGHNVFAILVDGDRAVSYGMLRGWDEGYATPSLGIAVRTDRQGRGLGRLMMDHLHRAAAARGARNVRLRVHPDNARARHLYESLGYRYRGEDRGELVMSLPLDPPIGAGAVDHQTSTPDRASRSELGVRLLRPEDPAWDGCLLNVPRSVFHSAGYHIYTRGLGAGEPYLAIVGDSRRGLAWPYLLRRVAPVPGLEWTDATDVHSAYGYPGPLAWGVVPGEPFLEHAIRLIFETWRSQGAVSAFTRFNPLLENASLLRNVVRRSDDGTTGRGVITGGPTVSVDLTLPPTAIRAAYGRDLARQIEVARRGGLRTEPDADMALLPTFADLYHQNMARLGATDAYYFDLDDFQRLATVLPGKVHLLVTSMGDTAVAAAGLFLEFGGVVEWHLVGSSDAYRRLSPSKVLVDDAIDWARDRGNRIMHMGGGHGGHEDSLLWFKSRFSATRHIFQTGRWVLEPHLYGKLVDARRAAISGPVTLDPEFFPIYRAPLIPDRSI